MSGPMKELLKAASKAAESNDPESAHADLDDALYAFVAAIDPKGAERLEEIVSRMTLWYA